jgi:hypothetical protein
MPRLSLAVAPAAPSTSPNLAAPRRSGQSPAPTRRTAEALAAAPDGSGRGLDHSAPPRAASEQATPRALAAHVATKIDRPRSAEAPVRPSQQMTHAAQARQIQSLRLALIVLGGALAGLVVRLALAGG